MNTMEEKNNNSIATECGLRLRRIRMARNMSQQELAEKMFTTPQSISRYEKEGISNIDTIHRLSEVLGYDLLTSESDAEGTVGEVGKEILSVLVAEGGRIFVSRLIAKHLYGLDMSRATEEIFKLERIGTCVREQYTDLDDRRQDELFLTAKGAITWKNLPGTDYFAQKSESLKEVVTYEQLLASDSNYSGAADSYQDFLDRKDWEKKIRRLPTMCSYRTNYIQYLFRHFTTGREMYAPYGLISGESAYFDILFSMAADITKDEIDAYMSPDPEGFREEMEASVKEIEEEMFLTESDPCKVKARKLFDRVGILENPAYSEDQDMDQEPDDEDSAEHLPDQARRLEQAHRQAESVELEMRRQGTPDFDERLEKIHKMYVDDNESELYGNPAYRIRMNRPEGSRSPYPTEWFSLAEVEEFIKQNLGPAVTDEEKALDATLAEINALCPATKEYYYSFPQDWEDAGIADRIRGWYGIGRKADYAGPGFIDIPEGITEELSFN